MKIFIRNRLVFLGISILFSFSFGVIIFNPEQAEFIVRYLGYWFILISFCIFVYHFYLVCLECLKNRCINKYDCIAFLGITILGLILLSQTQFLFKVVLDEIILVSTSMFMHHSREVMTSLNGYNVNGSFQVVSQYLDKRPVFFPFLLSLIHDISGYRSGNVFILNSVLFIFLLNVSYILGRKFRDWRTGILTTLLLSGIPLLVQSSSSGAFETLNMLMIILTILISVHYFQNPNSDRLITLCYSTILLAQVRYESIIFTVPVILIVIISWKKTNNIDLPWLVIIAPILLVIFPLQLQVFEANPEHWQLDLIADSKNVFGINYLFDNIGHATHFFFDYGNSQGNSLLLTIVGSICSISFFVFLLNKKDRKRIDENLLVPLTCFILSLLFITLLLLCYFWGQFDDPLTRRLSLPIHLLFVLITICLASIFINKSKIWNICFFIITLSIFIQTIPALSKRQSIKANTAASIVNWKYEIMEQYGNENFLIIDNSRLPWVIMEKSSLIISYLDRLIEDVKFHFDSNTFNNIFIYQKMTRGADGDLVPYPKYILPTEVKLEQVAQKFFVPFSIGRISRITSIDMDKSDYQTFWDDSKINNKEKIIKEFLSKWVRTLP